MESMESCKPSKSESLALKTRLVGPQTIRAVVVIIGQKGLNPLIEGPPHAEVPNPHNKTKLVSL